MPRNQDEASSTDLPRWQINDIRDLITARRTPARSVSEYVRHAVARQLAEDQTAPPKGEAIHDSTQPANPLRQGEAGDDLSQAPGNPAAQARGEGRANPA
jgi:hypothetical protein